MSEINLREAFASFKAVPARLARSAVTPEGALVMTCWYARFQKAQLDVLRYEENLESAKGEMARALRAHLAEALAQEYGVQLIVAVAPSAPKSEDQQEKRPQRPSRTTYHARKDLIGRVTFFDGERFIIEFRKIEPVKSKPAAAVSRSWASARLN